MMRTDAAAAATDLDRLVIRPYAGEADLPAIHGITNADFAADGVRQRWSLGELAAMFRHPSDKFDASRDVLVAELDGAIVGDGPHRVGRHQRW